MILYTLAIQALFLFCTITANAADIERFPPPDFESGYAFPLIQTPLPRSMMMSYLDVFVLIAALSLSAYFVIKKRDRRGIVGMTIFSLLYFGFYREGCVCAIGSIQNISLALFNPSYTVPLVVVAFFLLPLLFALFFGRVFCTGVCPLGAVQDLLLIKPVAVPKGLQRALGVVPYIYLGAAVLFAAMSSAFIICEYDPFVSIFRLSGNFNIIVLTISVLIISLFVGRPYCRFFCPYSVLLNLCSQVSQWRVTVGPGEGECVQCASCEEACPFDLITYPTPKTMEPMTRNDKTRIAVLLLIAPVCILLGGWITLKASDSFARVHATVRLAEQVALEDAGQVTVTTEASQAFRDSGESKVELFAQANQIRDRFATGSWILGGFLAIVIIAKLIVFSIKQERTYYEADRGSCLACGRCYCSCPLDKKWRKIQAAAAVQRDGV